MSTTPPPALDDDARRAASALAVERRRARARLKQQLRDGELDLADAFAAAAEDDVVAGTRLAEVLAALPRVGPIRAERIMTQCRVAPTRRLRGVGVRQQAALLAAVTAPHVGDRR